MKLVKHYKSAPLTVPRMRCVCGGRLAIDYPQTAERRALALVCEHGCNVTIVVEQVRS